MVKGVYQAVDCDFDVNFIMNYFILEDIQIINTNQAGKRISQQNQNMKLFIICSFLSITYALSKNEIENIRKELNDGKYDH